MARRPLNGARTVTGDTASHAKYGVGPATDYGADSGESVFAPISGWVTHWWSETGGWSVAVTSEDWKVTLQHNSGYRGPNSGWVKEGTLIALSGNTGNATTGPHVHMWIERARTGANRQSFEGWLRDFMGWNNTAQAGGRVPSPYSTTTANSGTTTPIEEVEEELSDYRYATRINPKTKKKEFLLTHPTDFPNGSYITTDEKLAYGFAPFAGNSLGADANRWAGLIATAKLTYDAAWARIARIAALTPSSGIAGASPDIQPILDAIAALPTADQISTATRAAIVKE
jgi:hypothetical protein